MDSKHFHSLPCRLFASGKSRTIPEGAESRPQNQISSLEAHRTKLAWPHETQQAYLFFSAILNFQPGDVSLRFARSFFALVVDLLPNFFCFALLPFCFPQNRLSPPDDMFPFEVRRSQPHVRFNDVSQIRWHVPTQVNSCEGFRPRIGFRNSFNLLMKGVKCLVHFKLVLQQLGIRAVQHNRQRCFDLPRMFRIREWVSHYANFRGLVREATEHSLSVFSAFHLKTGILPVFGK